MPEIKSETIQKTGVLSRSGSGWGEAAQSTDIVIVGDCADLSLNQESAVSSWKNSFPNRQARWDKITIALALHLHTLV